MAYSRLQIIDRNPIRSLTVSITYICLYHRPFSPPIFR